MLIMNSFMVLRTEVETQDNYLCSNCEFFHDVENGRLRHKTTICVDVNCFTVKRDLRYKKVIFLTTPLIISCKDKKMLYF